MKAISTINLKKLKNEVHVQFHESVISILIVLEVVNFQFEQLFASYKLSFDNETAALLLITKSEFTALINEQDRQRNSIFRGLSDTVKALRNHFDTEKQEAANRLWNNIFTHYGNVTKKSLDAETAAIKDLIRELKRPEIITVTNKLNVQDWVAKLEEENDKFHALMMNRYSETTEKTSFRMSTARLETDRYYRAIVASVENEVLLQNVSTPLNHFITELNAVVHRFKSILAHEQSKKKAINEE